MIQEILLNKFKENMKLEYDLIVRFMPDKVTLSKSETIEKKVHIDKSRLNEEGYLKSIAINETETTRAKYLA